MIKKKLLIKATSSVGRGMLHNAESHTIYYFCKWLIKDNEVFVSGIENNSNLTIKLNELGVSCKKPIFNYLSLRLIRRILHIPISIINTLIDAIKIKPDLMLCVGGVFYNGLAIVITGKILGIPTLVRSAEDHIEIANFERSYFLRYLKSRLIAFLSRITIKNSSYFMTVGIWSENYFRRTYNLSKERTFFIPGPIDYNNFLRNKGNKYIEETYIKALINKKKYCKTILFVGSEPHKGINELFQLCDLIHKKNLNIRIILISESNEISKKVEILNYKYFVNVIKPVDKPFLLRLIKNVDFLFWSTQLGVGYGQIIIESILCNTEIICYRPIGDVKNFVGESFYSNMRTVIKRLKGLSKIKKIVIPKYMDNTYLEIEHKKLIKNLLENKEH